MGKAELKLFVIVADGFLVLDFDGDVLSRPDVGHRGRKDVGPCLLHDTGPLPFLLSLFV
jgi:hypothetical protein